MEKKGKFRLPRIFNFFDIALIAVAAIIAIVLAVSSVIKSERDLVKVRYTVEATGFENGIEKLITVGDPVMDIVKKYDVGTIVSVEYEPTTRLAINYDTETVVNSEVPGQVTALVEIETDAQDTNVALSVEGNYPLRVGQIVSVRSPGLSFSGTVIEVREVSGDE